MDEREAWNCFLNSGRVEDYLIYSQLHRQAEEAVSGQWESVEVPDADQNGRLGDWGAEYGGK